MDFKKDQSLWNSEVGTYIGSSSFFFPSTYIRNEEADFDLQSNSNLSKVDPLLHALDRAGKRNIRYFALDLDYAELERTLANLPTYRNVSCYGLWGTYDDGFRWLNSGDKRVDPVTVLFLGSSIGSFSRAECSDFVGKLSSTLRAENGDAFLVAVDHCSKPSTIWKAYHDPDGT